MKTVKRKVNLNQRSWLWALGVAVVFSGCGDGSGRDVDRWLESQTLAIGNGSELQGLDPHIVTGVPENRVLQALCEGLLSYAPDGGHPLPAAAESWDISADGLVYTFHIRSNGTWWNGDPVVAQDFVWSWERVLTPALGSQYPEMLFAVENAEAFYRGEIEDFAAVGVKALSPSLLQVRLHQPTPYFLELLPHYSTFPVHAPTVLKHGAMTDRNSRWTRAENFVCNGPFTLAKWVLNDRIVAKRNPNYWGADDVRLNEIHYLPIDNLSTEEKAFRSGRLHITSTIPLESLPGYIEQAPPELRIEPYFGTYFYRFNTTRPPLNDVRVRRALAYAVDRELLVGRVTRGGEIVAQSFTPPGVQNYYSNTKVPFDPERARQLLADAGFADPADFPKLRLLYNTSEGHRKVAEAIQEMWRDHLGIQVELNNQDWKVYLERQRTMNYDIVRAGWIGDYPDPHTFLNIMVSERGNNNTGFANREFDALIEESGHYTGQRRLELLQRAENILIDEMPLVPIYIYTSKALVHTDVKGYYPALLDNHPPKHMYLSRDPAPTEN